MMSIIWFILVGALLFILIVGSGIAFFIYKRRYKTASSNQSLIITGPKLGDPKEDTRIFGDENGRSLKIVRGGGTRLKLFQTCMGLKNYEQYYKDNAWLARKPERKYGNGFKEYA
jgi:flotillin